MPQTIIIILSNFQSFQGTTFCSQYLKPLLKSYMSLSGFPQKLVFEQFSKTKTKANTMANQTNTDYARN